MSSLFPRYSAAVLVSVFVVALGLASLSHARECQQFSSIVMGLDQAGARLVVASLLEPRDLPMVHEAEPSSISPLPEGQAETLEQPTRGDVHQAIADLAGVRERLVAVESRFNEEGRRLAARVGLEEEALLRALRDGDAALRQAKVSLVERDLESVFASNGGPIPVPVGYTEDFRPVLGQTLMNLATRMEATARTLSGLADAHKASEAGVRTRFAEEATILRDQIAPCGVKLKGLLENLESGAEPEDEVVGALETFREESERLHAERLAVLDGLKLEQQRQASAYLGELTWLRQDVIGDIQAIEGALAGVVPSDQQPAVDKRPQEPVLLAQLDTEIDRMRVSAPRYEPAPQVHGHIVLAEAMEWTQDALQSAHATAGSAWTFGQRWGSWAANEAAVMAQGIQVARVSQEKEPAPAEYVAPPIETVTPQEEVYADISHGDTQPVEQSAPEHEPRVQPVEPVDVDLQVEPILVAAAVEEPPKDKEEEEEVSEEVGEAADVSAEPEPADREAPSGAGVVRGLKKILGLTQEPGGVPAEVVVPLPASPEKKKPKWIGDPLDQPVTLRFREEQLSNVVALLAQKAQVNVVAGADVTGTVTASLEDIPLRRALEIVLQMNDLGLIEEENILRIVPYNEAVVANRVTRMVFLKDSQAAEVKGTLDELVVSGPDAETMAISANSSTNVVIIAGPKDRVGDYERLARRLDVAEPTLPTVTEVIKLNYTEPADLKLIVESMLTADVGKAEADEHGRHLIVTDVPVIVDQVRELVEQVDLPVKQVSIEAMIVDVVLRDASQTGISWVFNLVRSRTTRGEIIGNLHQATLATDVGSLGTDALNAGLLSFAILSKEFDLHGAIAAEVQSRNAEILASPVIVTVENKTANIRIIQEFPYQELTQTTQGPPVATTEFKDIGVTLEVTPRVTHDDNIIVNIKTKESSISGLTGTGVPIEDKREAETTLRTRDAQTIFIGGLRNVSDRFSISKVPVLGDIPVVNFLFKDTDVEKVNTELLVFLMCRVLGEDLPVLTAEQQDAFDKIELVPDVPDAQRATFRSFVKPGEMRDPFWKWRRPE